MFGAVCLGAVRLRAVQAALYELFVHSEGIRAATQGVICLICVIYYVIQYQLKYIIMRLMLFIKQLVIMCPNSYNHFGTSPMQLLNNEMLRSRLK